MKPPLKIPEPIQDTISPGPLLPQFSIIGIAASLAVAMILLAVGAGLALRVFCFIAGVCV